MHEFYAIATHPRIYAPPSTPAQALEQLRAWRESPSLVLLAEDDAYWPVLESFDPGARRPRFAKLERRGRRSSRSATIRACHPRPCTCT